MAKCSVQLPDDFLKKLSKLGDQTDAIVSEVLTAGGEVVCDAVRSRLQSVVGTDTEYPSRSTGELVSALGVSQPRLNRSGDFDVKVGFAEPRRDGKPNALLANLIEYGTSKRKAKPFLAPGVKAAKKSAVEAMERKFHEEVSKL